MVIDTHAHVYHRRFDDDREAVLERAFEAGVERILLPAIDVASIHDALALCERYPGVYAMAALHPSETREATEAEFDEVVELCSHPRVVAVGESGLDYYWDRSFDERQHEFLRRHATLAVEQDLPLVLHLRDRTQLAEVFPDVVRILKEVASPSLRGVFHCFTGTEEMAQEARDLGFLLGIGGVLTFKNSGLDEVVRGIPLEALVLETDAPFLAPEPHRGKRNEPGYVALVAQRLARTLAMPLEEVAAATTTNAERLFRLADRVA